MAHTLHVSLTPAGSSLLRHCIQASTDLWPVTFCWSLLCWWGDFTQEQNQCWQHTYKHAVLLRVPAVCVLATTWSTFCRCWMLLMFPSMLSSRGQTYLLLYILSVLWRGAHSCTLTHARNIIFAFSKKNWFERYHRTRGKHPAQCAASKSVT